MSSNIYDIIKKYEWDKTEPETLTDLVKSAIQTGDFARADLKTFRDAADEVDKILDKEHLIHDAEINQEDYNKYSSFCATGIDGSFQCVGGIGGLWYVPTSIARITFKDGLKSQPIVKVAATINTVNQQEYFNYEGEASRRMLIGETDAIKEWVLNADAKKKNVIFIDGPVVDPPNTEDKEYIKIRCEALNSCFKKEILVLGCVKRIFGRSFINFVIENFSKNDSEKTLLNKFTSDVHLISYIFIKRFLQGKKGPLFTIPIDISDVDSTSKYYLDNGIRIYSALFQKDIYSYPIRLDAPVSANVEVDKNELASEIVKITSVWSYPRQYIPLPVMIAHEKSNVRKGCAEVLYEEIITRSTSPDLYDNLVRMKLSQEG